MRWTQQNPMSPVRSLVHLSKRFVNAYENAIAEGVSSCEYPTPSAASAPKPAAPRAAAQPFVPAPFESRPDPYVSNHLREISERLRSIEASLAAVHLSAGTEPLRQASLSQDDESPRPTGSLSHDSESSSSPSAVDLGHLSNPSTRTDPMQTVISQLDALEATVRTTSPVDGCSPPADWSLGGQFNGLSSSVSTLFAGMTVPDAIVRGVMDEAECEASFNIFFLKMAPWMLSVDVVRDRSPTALRERSPLLFHTILLTTSYYLMETSERARQVYYSLTALVNELLAPIIISGHKDQVNADFLRALTLLLLYKPVQFAQLHAQGITNPETAERVSKLNASSSSVLNALLVSTTKAMDLARNTVSFGKAFSMSEHVPSQVVSDLRLYYWLCCIDSQGALSLGRAGGLDLNDAVKTTRLFATLKHQVCDVRLAASVELYACANQAVSGVWSSGKRLIPYHELRRVNQDLDEWERYWTEPLQKASRSGDSIAYVAATVMANYVRIVLNGTVFDRFLLERRQSLAHGGSGRPDLSDDAWSFLDRATAAAESLVFSLSTESRVDGDVLTRRTQWPISTEPLAVSELEADYKSSGPRPPLHLDSFVVDVHRTAFDNVTCVLYTYTLIFLARLCNTGLIRCELATLVEEYRTGISMRRPHPFMSGLKLGRLLELGAGFLEATAPTTTHPARRHARILRTILAAGTQGQMIPVDLEGEGTSPTAAEKTLFAMSQPTSNGIASSPSNGPQPQQHFAPQSQDAPGEALAAILSGLDPAWLSFIGPSDPTMVNNLDVGSALDGMAVDWDALETSVNSQHGQPLTFPPFNADHSIYSGM